MLAPGHPKTVFLERMEGRSKVHVIVYLGLLGSLSDIGPEQRVQSALYVDALWAQVTFNRFQPFGPVGTDAAMFDEVLEYSQLARRQPA